MEVRMEDDLRAARRGPAHRLGVTPSFMADADAERQRTNRKHVPLAAGLEGRLFRRIELHLVVESQAFAITVDDQRRDAQRIPFKSFRPKNHCDIRITRRLRCARPGGFKE